MSTESRGLFEFYNRCVKHIKCDFLEERTVAFLLCRLFRAEQSHILISELREWLLCSGLQSLHEMDVHTNENYPGVQGILQTTIEQYRVNILYSETLANDDNNNKDVRDVANAINRIEKIVFSCNVEMQAIETIAM